MARGKVHRHRTFWTRDRVLDGLRRFYADFGYTALSMEQFNERTKFTGRTPEGRTSNAPHHRRYPSMGPITKYFRSMREAWTAAGFVVDKGYEEWSEMEDWFVVESCGILPREEVSKLLHRTVPAIKRRLYDLGHITAKERWGWTLTGASKRLGVSSSIIGRYIKHGTIPCFHGYKLIYVNPADMAKIVEVDWDSDRISDDTRETVRRSLIQRALKIIKFRDSWRDHEVYKFHKKPGIFTHRISGPRKPALLKTPASKRPNEISVGDWITTTQTIFGRAGRIGKVLAVHYSPAVCNRRDGSHRATWIARIEFPRLRTCRAEDANEKRIMYSLPLDTLVKTKAPKREVKPLSMNPDAIRGRARRAQYQQRNERAQERLKEFTQV